MQLLYEKAVIPDHRFDYLHVDTINSMQTLKGYNYVLSSFQIDMFVIVESRAGLLNNCLPCHNKGKAIKTLYHYALILTRKLDNLHQLIHLVESNSIMFLNKLRNGID